MFNILNGGKHAQDSTDFQEFMVMPVGVDDVRARRCAPGAEIFAALRAILHDEGHRHRPGRRGRLRAVARRRTRPRSRSSCGRSRRPATGPARTSRSPSTRRRPSWSRPGAASTAHRPGTCSRRRAGRSSRGELIDLWADWVARYPIVSIEDGLAEDDWDGWTALTARLGDRVQLVGDDLLVTNTDADPRGRSTSGAANSVLIKLNQIGTLTETIDAIELARRAGWSAIVSHRSGETEDTTIADLVVAMGTGQIKTGAPSRSERVAKYNRLLRIAGELGDGARYLGRGALSARPAGAAAWRVRDVAAGRTARAREPLRRPRRHHRRLGRDRHGGHDRASASCWSSRSSRSTGCSPLPAGLLIGYYANAALEPAPAARGRGSSPTGCSPGSRRA